MTVDGGDDLRQHGWDPGGAAEQPGMQAAGGQILISS